MRFYKLDMHLRDARILIEELREELRKDREENEELCARIRQKVQELKAQCSEMQNKVNCVRSDAIREFAKRLKEYSVYADVSLGICPKAAEVVTVEQIERIAKEMVGEADANC